MINIFTHPSREKLEKENPWKRRGGLHNVAQQRSSRGSTHAVRPLRERLAASSWGAVEQSSASE